ncbi:UNVERIFIED_CONTAM: hypothetical protein Slati_3190400 [Sesamum latifolium]|uniref:RNase H type-1 domain-containing protein n=1 Tax=Sesamum latifolium TaxID=2727402 RepID=A0AAW2UW38_9LAMI
MTTIGWKGDYEVAAKFGFHLSKPKPRPPMIFNWKKPTNGWWKLNCDGASKGNPGPSGAGGLIRDSNGRMIIAFADFLEEHTNTYAELYAVVRGIQLAQEARNGRLETPATPHTFKTPEPWIGDEFYTHIQRGEPACGLSC